MTGGPSRRALARDVIDAGLSAADAALAVRRHLRVQAPLLHVGPYAHDLRASGRVRVFGSGKAFGAMAAASEDILGEHLHDGFGIVKDGGLVSLRRIQLAEAGHPVPDARGLQATERMLRLLQDGRPDDMVIFLLSGGASALLEALPPRLSLEDLRAANERLLRSGAPIAEVNAARREMSLVKGGRLAAYVAPARCVVLVLSDVLGNSLRDIGSGPLYDGTVPHLVIGDNRLMADAAIRKAGELGYDVTLVSSALEGEARDAGRMFAELARSGSAGQCFIASGETTVTVRGAGRGGRNQEMALAFALAAEGLEGVLFASVASDGTDGPTEAAGAMADGTTVARGLAVKRNAHEDLQRNDAYGFFGALGDLVVTGYTGTNVNDLQLLLIS